MAGVPAVLDLLLELEDDQLRSLRVADDRAADTRAIHRRRPDRDGVAITDEEDAIERDRRAGVGRHALDEQLAARLHAILLSAGGHDGVHVCSPGSARAWPRRTRAGAAHTKTGRVLSPRDLEVYRAIGGVSTKRSRVRTARRARNGRSSASTTSSGLPAPLASSWSTARRRAVWADSSTSITSTSSMSGRRSRLPASLRRSLSPRRRIPRSCFALSRRTTAPRSASEVSESSPVTSTSYSAPRSWDAAEGKPCHTSFASR